MRRRGTRRGLLHNVGAILVTGAALALAGCGSGDDSPSPSEAEKAADVEVLNAALGRELAAVGAYTRGLPLLNGPALAIVREFRAQEQEHVDAITKAIRGLGASSAPEPPELDLSGLRNQADFLSFAYGLESTAVADYLHDISKLNASWPRALFGSIAANEAQQLTVLRQALGADPAASVPEAFEAGTTAPPGTG